LDVFKLGGFAFACITASAAAILARRSRFNEVASVFVRLDHLATRIVNATHNIMRADDKLTAFVAEESAVHAR